MNLPDSRNTNYAPSQKIKSADLNALQDCVIGGKHGLLTHWFPPVTPCFGAGAFAPTNLTYHQGKIVANANVAFLFGSPIPIALPEGTVIYGIAMNAKGTGAAGTIVASLERWKGDATTDAMTVTTAATIANPPAAYATYTNLVAAGARMTVAPNQGFVLNFVMDLMNMELTTVGLLYKRP